MNLEEEIVGGRGDSGMNWKKKCGRSGSDEGGVARIKEETQAIGRRNSGRKKGLGGI